MAYVQGGVPGNTGVRQSGAYDSWANDYRNWQYSNLGYNKSGTPMPMYSQNYGRPKTGVNGAIDRLKAEADPRAILKSPAMSRLMELSKGGGALAAADQAAEPALARLREFLSTNDPLGTAELPTLVRQRGMAGLRGAESGGRRRVEESFGGMHGSVDPSAMAFMKDIISSNAAGGLGEVERGAAEAKIAERSAAGAFQKGVADSINAWAGTRGGLAAEDARIGASAAGSALTAESFAHNTWAQVFADLLGIQLRGQHGGGGKRPIRGYDKNGQPIYDNNPFPGIQPLGSYLGGWEPNDVVGPSNPTGYAPAPKAAAGAPEF